MKNLFKLTILMVMAFMVAGCFFEEEASIGEMPNMPNVPSVIDENKPVILDVYWDATYSMQGYTTIPQQNIYQTLPDNLEDIGISLGEARFFKFGSEIQPLEGRQHRQFMTPQFYNEVITPIHKVVEASDSEHLSVVVTDLFESDADWSNVAKQLKAKYFDNHQCVAIIGIKNPFRGDIFDVGYAASGKFYYDSGADTAKYRPFYMLVMGSSQNVRSFVGKCKERIGTGENIRYLLFSDELVENVPDLNSVDFGNNENIFRDSKLQVTDKRMVEYGIDSQDKEAKLEAVFKFIPFTDACQVEAKDLKPVIKISRLIDGVWAEEADTTSLHVSLEPVPDSDNEFVCSVNFMPSELLPSDSVTLLQTFITPGRDGMQLPSWVREWNMDNQASFDANQFDGSKTINLVRLLTSLKDYSLAASYPSIANIFMVIKN